jgi:hypothetical protein
MTGAVTPPLSGPSLLPSIGMMAAAQSMSALGIAPALALQ